LSIIIAGQGRRLRQTISHKHIARMNAVAAVIRAVALSMAYSDPEQRPGRTPLSVCANRDAVDVRGIRTGLTHSEYTNSKGEGEIDQCLSRQAKQALENETS